jgi:hypothetical protein
MCISLFEISIFIDPNVGVHTIVLHIEIEINLQPSDTTCYVLHNNTP